MKKTNTCGFTLVELLIVISIIGVLSTIGMTVYSSAQNQAKIAATQATLNSVYKQIEQVRLSRQQFLGQITGSYCSDCAACRSDSKSQACINSMTTAFVTKLGFTTVPRDGWGDVIRIDENEAEPSGCRNPDIQDGLYSSHGQGLNLPFLRC